MNSATGGSDDQQIKNLRMGMDIVLNVLPQVIRAYNTPADETKRVQIINGLRNDIRDYIEREKEYQDSMDALANTRIKIRDQVEVQQQNALAESNSTGKGSKECTFSVDADKIFEEEKLKLPKVSSNYVDKHVKMKEFESKLAIELQCLLDCENNDKVQTEDSNGLKITQDDGGEITTTEMVSTIDPITRQEMTDPVKNTLCGHTYEKNSILQLISQNRKTGCPMAGCANTNPVSQNHLILNSDVLKLIQQKNRKLKR